jgi:Ran-binding protein 1
MRQEKTMKVIANHFLDPRITMTPNAGASDKSWVWVAFDFSDGELVETVEHIA